MSYESIWYLQIGSRCSHEKDSRVVPARKPTHMDIQLYVPPVIKALAYNNWLACMITCMNHHDVREGYIRNEIVIYIINTLRSKSTSRGFRTGSEGQGLLQCFDLLRLYVNSICHLIRAPVFFFQFALQLLDGLVSLLHLFVLDLNDLL